MNSKLRKFLAVLSLSFASSPLLAATLPVQIGVAPDNSQQLLLSVINGAQSSLLINIYEFASPTITAAIAAQVKKGVTVRFLMEGEPTGKMKQSQRTESYALRQVMLAQKNPANQFSIMWDGKQGTLRRFVFDHAKYVVADGSKVLVSSENFAPGGHGAPGMVGNRGWEIVVNDRALAAQMTQMFDSDADPANKDIVDFLKKDVPWDQDPGADLDKPARPRSITPLAIQSGTATAAKLVVSPKSGDDIVALIRSANTSIDLEFMDLPSTWKLPSEAVSPIVDALVTAARRGVKVRVLMNDANAFAATAKLELFDDAPVTVPRNEITAKFLKTFGKCEGLDLDAKIVSVAKVQISYIHNKGILVDRNRAFVSSINGTQNSVENNREVALVVDSTDAGEYYGKAFDFDWAASPAFPMTGITCN